MLEAHLPLLIVLILTTGVAVGIMLLSARIGPRRPSRVKSESFECGNPPSGTARERFNVKFFLVAILFLVFDIEAVFIYPWAVVFGDAVRRGEVGRVTPLFVMLEMVVFVAVILVGLVYVWRKGALDWNLGRVRSR